MLFEKNSKEEFIKIHTKRYKTLGTPKLIIPSIQANMKAGNLVNEVHDGIEFMRIPLNILHNSK